MKIHEYQAKKLLEKYSVPIPNGEVASTVDGAKQIAKKLDGFPVVLKAQIHAGGRGKGGGVKPAQSMDEVVHFADQILGMTLVTAQTGPEGQQVRKILVERGLNISEELYLGITIDRSNEKIVAVASKAGGMDIEAVAEESPEKIIKVYVNPLLGILPFHCRAIAFGLKLPPEVLKSFYKIVTDLFRLFVECDCSLLEINPLVITKEKTLMALDAKINFDDNALFRHPDLADYRDLDEEDPFEVEASKFNLNYIKLDGNIGNMVNGAGLAMATMDIIKRAGAEPANFLDVGGGADEKMVESGLKIILSDKNVKAILINIFGGILRCDVLAKGVVEAARKTGINLAVVVRMEGTNVDEGRRILAESGLNLTTAVDLKDAAHTIAKLVNDG